MPYDPKTNHRRSIRYHEYDYTQPSAYFVTIVTYHRLCIFGEIIQGGMKLNLLGDIAKNEWFQTSIHRSYIQLDVDGFVVMPNHVHGLIRIVNTDDSDRRGAATLRPYAKHDAHTPYVLSGSLGAIIRGYKSAVTYQINSIKKSRHLPVWQRNYYEHIIRNEKELNDIADYILSNPGTWLDDPEFTPELH